MSFSESYLGQLRKRIGSELVLMPGAMIAVRRPVDGRVLFTRRGDDGTWCLPTGAAEPGGSFAAMAIGELKEEAGVTVAEDGLIPFATLSEAELHTIVYPNGDETHCFASASWLNPGAVSPSRTVRRRRRSSLPTRRTRLRRFTDPPPTPLSC